MPAAGEVHRPFLLDFVPEVVIFIKQRANRWALQKIVRWAGDTT